MTIITIVFGLIAIVLGVISFRADTADRQNLYLGLGIGFGAGALLNALVF